MNRLSRERRPRPAGFTLLEVILALAILAGAMAVLGELVRSGTRSASEARDLTHAALLCDSVLAGIVSGAVPAESASGVPLADDPEWVYSVELNPIESDSSSSLVSVRVTVSRDPSLTPRPIGLSLVRWMKDPNDVSAETEPTESESSTDTSSNSGSAAGSGGSAP